MKHRPVLLPTVIVLFLCLVAADVSAGGYFLPIRGIRPLGRAGAVVVSGAGPNAIWYNPAALAELHGWHLLVDVAFGHLNSNVSRTPRQEPNGDILVYEAVENELPVDVIPSIIATGDFGVEELTVALGVLPPYGARYRYPVDGSQRYAAVDNSETLSATFELAAAVEITDWFRAGAGFQMIYYDLKFYTTASAYTGLFGRPEDEDLDILLSLHSVDPIILSGNFGLWFEPIDQLQLALMVQFPARVEDRDSQIEVRLPDHAFFDNAEVRGSSVAEGLDLPTMIRGGVRYLHDRGDVELSFTWEAWSVHESIEVSPDNVTIVGIPGIDEFVIGPMSIVQEWENTIAFSLGSDFHLIDDLLTLRGGLLYESSAVPEHRLSAFQIGSGKIAPTIGVSVEIPDTGLVIDAGFAHYFFFTRHISNSAVEQINPTFEEGAVIVGNGTYEAGVAIGGIGFEMTF